MMLTSFLKFRRAVRTCLRSFRAALQGPERGSARVKRVLTAFSPEQRSMLADDPDDYAHVYFRQKAFNRTKEVIATARVSIDMQMFIWLADDMGREMARLLVDAADRGVAVTVRKEVIGDVFEFADDFAATKNDAHPVWQAFWKHPRITVLHNNRHDHSKTWIVDNDILLVSSMNIGDAYCNDWHECTVELRGNRFVQQYREGTAALPKLTHDGQIQVLRSSSESPMLSAVLELLRSAKTSIRIEMAYFSDPQIVELLAQKTREGVYLFLVIPHSPGVHHHSNMAAVSALLSRADKTHTFVFRYTRGLLHTKMIVIDRRTLFIGSTNLMTSSLTKMGETNVIIHRRPSSCLRVVRRQFTKDVLQSVRLEAKEITRTFWHRCLSRFSL